MKTKISIVNIIILLLIVIVTGCTSEPSQSQQNDENTQNQSQISNDQSSGGTLKLAWTSQPPTLDSHITNTNVVRDLARQIFETLLTFNSKYEITPMLAESYSINENEKTITFVLRKGVKFHNGKEMKAEDVVASMTKWQNQNKSAKSVLGNSVWEAKDDYTVVLHLDTPYKPLAILYSIADVTQAASIMPKEVAEAADDTGAKEFIGTGPFMVEEWKRDQYLHLKKFADYQPVSAPADGLAGKKEALVDDIYVYFVPDDSTRVNGLISGEYDYAFEVPFDSIEQLESTPNIVNYIYPYGFQTLVFNKKEGLFKDVRARQAVNLALDKEKLLSLAFTDKRFYKLEPAYMRPEQKAWYTDAGKENYYAHDPEKAKQLLKEAGYNGEEIVILTSSDYKYHYDSAVVTKEALEDIGMNVKLDVTDWATLLQRRSDPKMWNIFYTSFTTVPTPLYYPFLESKANYPGWTNNPQIDKLLEDIRNSATQEEATAKFTELQALIWEDLPVINVGMTNRITSYSDKVTGYTEFMGPIFWNVRISK